MIKEEDVMLSKMSYTDKDFASIYPDLLDLAKQLTDSWDPSLSNESDPGVVLLKEGAFIADHGNYNIDKNILENFLPTATQESSVRNILDMNGYTPEYYISAIGDVSFTYQPKDEIEDFIGFVIPPYKIVITNADESVFYTQLEPLTISRQYEASSTKFIEGTLKSLEVNGSKTILLENLDDNNRLYFTIKQVAENGIIIKNIPTSTQENGDLWEKVNYISTQPLNSKVYKVGYDSSLGVPYVEFPSDIANIIGNGITVDYIVSSGEKGNIKANTLVKISTPAGISVGDELEIDTGDFNLTNSSSIMNGKNPETINEMYRSFRKVVGTFDTLVTTRDYSNAIYNADDGTNKLVSNDVVTDRNNDYNNALKIITYDQWGEYFEYASKLLKDIGFNLCEEIPENPKDGDIIFEIIDSEGHGKFKKYTGIPEAPWIAIDHLGYNDFIETIEAMTPFDLCIYALKAFSLSDYIDSVPYKAIEKSFEPITNNTMGKVVKFLDENKCINHNFFETKDDEVICFKNYVPLNITITPYSKVTKQEKEEIIDNIYIALSKNFNASKVDFGEELNYDEVLEVLLNCDNRIKNIRLEDFEYKPYAMIKDSSKESGYREVSVYEDSKLLLDIIAKNVLAGRLCLFDFDDEFTFKYGQIKNTFYNNIASIETDVKIEAQEDSEVMHSHTDENKNKVLYSYDDINTKIALVGQSGKTRSIVIGPGEEGILESDEELRVDKKGVINVYSSSSNENTISIINNTSEAIGISYNGPEYEWFTLKDGYIYVVNSTEILDEYNYDLVYKPKENEFIEVAYNNYITDAVFPTYVSYRYVGSEPIEANTDHILASDETLILLYTENNVQKTKEYKSGDVIRTNFELKPTSDDTVKGIVKTDVPKYANTKWATLSASQQIEHRQLMLTKLESANTPCYWIVNNNTNTLFFDSDSKQERTNEIILGSGEYFVYSNANKDSMVLLGPGSLIRRSENDQNNWTLAERTTIKDITDNGYNANIKWVSQDFSNGNALEHQELNILTLGVDDELDISNWLTGDSISNKWSECDGDIWYSISGGEKIKLNKLPSGENYRLRSRLDINVDNVNGQRLYSGQKFIVKCEEYPLGVEIEGSDEDNVVIQSSTPINLYGDSETNISEFTNGDSVLNFNQYEVIKPKLYIDNYKAQLSGQIDPEVQYYELLNGSNVYTEIDKDRVKRIVEEEGITYFSELYVAYPNTTWYAIPEEFKTINSDIEEINGKYTIDISNPGRAEFQFGYECTFNSLSDDHKEYILPVFLNYGGADITAKLETIEGDVIASIQDFIKYGKSEPESEEVLKNTEMYLLRVCIPTPNIDASEINKTIKATFKLVLSWSVLPEEPEIITVLNPVITKGVNTNFGSKFTLGDVLGKIDDLIKHSTKPNTKPYYIYKPENSIAIQDPEVEDPNIFWDKNNIVNCITIPQIDIRRMANKEDPTVDIIKSMRNYK